MSPPLPGAPDLDKHVDIDFLIEDYAWRCFKDQVGIKKAGLDSFKHLERDDVEFIIVSFLKFDYIFQYFL